jgi:membrane protein DedA with SNARE-associated domain
MSQITQILAGHASPVLFLVIFVEQLGVPIPAAPVLVAAGALAAEGALNPGMALGVATLACVLADFILFHVGRQGGEGLLRILSRLSLSDASGFGRTERFFTKYCMSAIIAAKFVPGLGLLISPMAGALGVSRGKFLKLDVLGSLVYGSFYLGLGVAFSNQVNAVLELISGFGAAPVALAPALLMIFVGYRFVQRRKASHPASEPASGALATISGA